MVTTTTLGAQYTLYVKGVLTAPTHGPTMRPTSSPSVTSEFAVLQNMVIRNIPFTEEQCGVNPRCIADPYNYPEAAQCCPMPGYGYLSCCDTDAPTVAPSTSPSILPSFKPVRYPEHMLPSGSPSMSPSSPSGSPSVIPTASPSSAAVCARYAPCRDAGFTSGLCCPATNGTYFSCCTAPTLNPSSSPSTSPSASPTYLKPFFKSVVLSYCESISLDTAACTRLARRRALRPGGAVPSRVGRT